MSQETHRFTSTGPDIWQHADVQPLTLQPDFRDKLRAVEYPSATLYISPPSEKQLSRRGRPQRPPQDEIRYVETPDMDVLVDPQAMPHLYLTQAETRGLIWGGLGKTIAQAAQEQGSSPSTCHSQRESLFTKLSATTMTHAVAIAFERGVLGKVPDHDYPLLELTPREYDVLAVLSHGKTKLEAGKQLFITRDTVRTHTMHLLKANRVANCAHATLRAYLAGQLPLDKADA